MSNLGLAYQANPATKPIGWRLLDATGTTYGTALATIGDTSTRPVNDMATGRFYMTPLKAVVQLAFLVGDANNETAAFGVYGVREIMVNGTKYWTYCTLLNGSCTAGAKALTGSGTTFWADTITVASAVIPTSSYRTYATADDVAVLEFDCRDFEQVLVVGTLSGSTGAAFNIAESYASL